MPDRSQDPYTQLGMQWLESLRHASALAQDAMAAAALLWDFQKLRTRWFMDLSRATDAYLRSPAVLELIRLNLGGTTRSGR
jgi:hypothetical protein